MRRSGINKTNELNPIVVTGSGTHQRLKNTITPVTVINANDIRQTGTTDFMQVMQQTVPGLSFLPNSMGSYLMLNGLSNKYVLILVNGKKLIGDISNNIDLGRLDLSRVKRIEVLNGAGSSLYGSDAIAGVINIITADPQDELSLTSSSRFSGKGIFTQTANLDIVKGKWGSSTSFKHDEADSWQNSPYEQVTENGATTLRETLYPLSVGYHSNMLNQKFTFKPNERLSTYLSGNYYWKLTDRPRARKDVTGGYNYDLHYESWRFEGGGVYKFSPKASLQLDLTADDYDQHHRYTVESGKYQPGDYTFTKNQRFYDAELRGILHFYDQSTTVFGLDARDDQLKASSGNIEGSASTLSAYAQHETPIVGGLKAVAGLRFDHHEQAGSHLSPKLALMQSVGDFRFRATYAHGFIAPQLNELYYKYYNDNGGRVPSVIIGNEHLKPGKSNYLSVSTEWRTRRVSAGVTGYLNFLDQMITRQSYTITDEVKAWALQHLEVTQAQVDRMTRFSRYVNFDRAIVRGFQTDVTARLPLGFSLTGGYNFAYSRGKLSGEWQNIERSMRHTATLSANYAHRWLHYGLSVNLNGRLQSKRYYPGEEAAPGYGLWNLNTRHSFTPFIWVDADFSLGVDNIFNRKDMRPYGLNRSLLSPGRMLVFGLTLKFKNPSKS
ncbi:MAG: TonB-dependent receptor [Bacteroidaceae bacterium]|nr:TonB-dependent receptor [Bacteroidaceae bacterium]